MNEIERIRREYADREKRLSKSNLYSIFNPSHLFAVQQRQRATLSALRKKAIIDFSNLKILEVGCGNGGILLEFLNFGAAPYNLYGIDLLQGRLEHAHMQLEASHFINADGQHTPFSPQSFDLVLQYTALSSVLNLQIRQKIAKDMLRVLKPNGMILWYDFWLNPVNHNTHGMSPAEIRSLFTNCTIEFYKITLAPPLARRVVHLSWGLALFLEGLNIFNTHYLALIFPKKEIGL